MTSPGVVTVELVTGRRTRDETTSSLKLIHTILFAGFVPGSKQRRSSSSQAEACKPPGHLLHVLNQRLTGVQKPIEGEIMENGKVIGTATV